MPTSTTPSEASVLEAQLLEIVREMLVDLGRENLTGRVGPRVSFERDLGLTSLDLVELVVRCESKLDLELPDSIAEQAETPAGWVRAILEGGTDREAKSSYRIVPPSREAPPPPARAGTLVDVLREHADFDPGRIHVHIFEDGTGQGITCGQLYEGALGVAAGLAERGLRRGQTVAIMLPNGADFFYAFFGAMLAGGIPVPVYPPASTARIEEYVRRQLMILRNAKARFLISFERVEALARIMRVNLPRLADVTTVDELRRMRGRPPSVDPPEIALIQYTSGSTGNPKGVMLTHANLLANLRAIGERLRVRPDDAVVSWLPLASDLGLVGCWMFSLYWGAPLTLLPPLEFLERPECWLWAIHDSRGTLSAAPNFAFELAARRIPLWTLEGIDLSCWRAAVIAGEPVLAGTVERFTRRFAPFGFPSESMLPAYGLAECSVALAIPESGGGPRLESIRQDALEQEGLAEPGDDLQPDLRFYSAGKPLAGHQVRAVDAGGQTVSDRVQGRLQFRGPSRASGYFRNPRASRAAIADDGWMDTGDLGYLAEGEVFLTGRDKDLILREGRAICPRDVELVLSEIPGVERGGAAVIGVPDAEAGTERLVAIVETAADNETDRARLSERIGTAVVEVLGFPPDRIELIAPGHLPRTANQKLRRNQTRQAIADRTIHQTPGPAWRQIARLQWVNLGPLALLAARRSGRILRGSAAFALAHIVAWLAGSWFRVTGSRRGLGIVARGLLAIIGKRYSLATGDLDNLGDEVIVANRSGRLDPLVMAALAPGRVYFAGEEALLGLPGWAAFVLCPFVVNRSECPRGILIVFPDGPAGVTPARSRFRLDPLVAAMEAGCLLVPVAIREQAHIHAGAPLAPEAGADPAAVRDRIRAEISRLYA